MKHLSVALLPGASALVAAVVVMWVPGLRQPVSQFLADYPLLLPAAGALLAVVYRRRRALYAVVMLGVAAWAWWLPGRGDEELGRAVVGAVAVLLPVNLLGLGVCRERTPLSAAGLAGLGMLAVQPLAVAYAWHAYHPTFLALPWVKVFPAGAPLAMPLPDASLLAFAAAFVVLAARAGLTTDPLDGGVLFALVGSLWALASGPGAAAAQLLFNAATLAVVTSLVFASARWAFTDPLTGLPGRRACEEALAQLGAVFTVAVVDIDHFKSINDRHGHAAGDQVLRLVAARLAEVGGSGRAFRWGGEEFVVIFANRGMENSLPFLEGVHRAIAATPFRIRGADRPRRRPKQPTPRPAAAPGVPVTVSMGVAASGHEAPLAAGEALRAADAAMYRAKNSGRNRICTA